MAGGWSPMSMGAANVDSVAQHSRNQLMNGILQYYGLR